MKKLSLLFCTAVLLLAACDKEEPASNSEQPETTQTDAFHAAPDQNYPATAEVIYDAVTDVEGNHYDAVRIGDQVWMASNLRTRHYANSEALEETNRLSFTDPFFYIPSGDIASYGYLYNWPAVMHGESPSSTNPSGVQGICPKGWHVPSKAEWEQLINYCSTHDECMCNESSENIAKSIAANYGWRERAKTCAVGTDLSANNATGFSALPAGAFCPSEYSDIEGEYVNFRKVAGFWCTTDYNDLNGYSFGLIDESVELCPPSLNAKNDGCSVRCIKD